MWNGRLCHRRFPSQSAAQHRHLVPAWVPPPCHWPILVPFEQSMPPHQVNPNPKLVGSTSLRSLSMCCSITQLSASFISTSASAIGRSFRGQGCGICCPGSGFLGPQSSGAIVAAVHSLAVLCGTIARVQVPIHSRNTPVPPSDLPIAAMSAFLHPLGPGSAASTTPLAILLTSFASGGANFAAAGLTAAHCILIFNVLVVNIHSNQRMYHSCCLPVLRCACIGLQDLWRCKYVRGIHLV